MEGQDGLGKVFVTEECFDSLIREETVNAFLSLAEADQSLIAFFLI